MKNTGHPGTRVPGTNDELTDSHNNLVPGYPGTRSKPPELRLDTLLKFMSSQIHVLFNFEYCIRMHTDDGPHCTAGLKRPRQKPYF
eukprot:2113011-Rhodomonas_salina.2